MVFCGSLTIIKIFHWELIARAIRKQSLHEKSHLINAVAGSWGELEQETERIRWRLELSKSLSYHTLGTVSPLPWAHGSAFLQRASSHIAEGRAKAVGKMILCKKWVCPPTAAPLGHAPHLDWPFPSQYFTQCILGKEITGLTHCDSVATSLDKLCFQSDGTHFLISPRFLVSSVEMQWHLEDLLHEELVVSIGSGVHSWIV